MNETDGEKARGSTTHSSVRKSANNGMFERSDYIHFMLGVFVVGGMIGIPLTYGLWMGLGYFDCLPWSLASCMVFLIGFRRNGTISWGRAVPAIVAVIIGANVYSHNTGKPAFAAGGFLGFLLVLVCGYIGIGIVRILKR